MTGVAVRHIDLRGFWSVVKERYLEQDLFDLRKLNIVW